ncbi:MAG: hypothetical protein DYG90_00520 [Chloroflexi bacterium CFX6]|nr:hypothetical protein [Chloroflexi bacterium CFX6]
MTPPPTDRELRWWTASEERCRKYGVPYTPGIRLADVFARTGGRCWICGTAVGTDWQAEHIFPLSRGGAHRLSNLAAAHRSCNQRKGINLVCMPEGPERHALIVSLAAAKRLRRLPPPRRTVCQLGPFSVGPRTVIARLNPPAGRVRACVGEVDEIRHALGDQQARVYMAGSYMAIEVANPYPEQVDASSFNPRGAVIPIGFGPEMERIDIDFDITPQVLLAGQTGSGKSVALDTIVWGAAKAGWRLILTDTVSRAWTDKADLSALLLGVPATRPDVTATLEEAVRIMLARDPNNLQDRILVVVDEAGREPNQDLSGLDTRGMSALAALIANGRKYGVHCVVADQRPVAERLSRTIVDQCTAKIGLRVGDHWTSKNAIGVTGAELLLGRGDALLVRPGAAGSEAMRIQVAQIGAARWREIPRGGVVPVVGMEPKLARKADDTTIIEVAKTHGLTNGHAIFQAAKRLGLGTTGNGIGMDRAQRIAQTL